MKSKNAPLRGLMILFLFVLAIGLVACERPLQPEAQATAEAQPTVDPATLPTVLPPPTVEIPAEGELPPDSGDGTATEGTEGETDTGTEAATPEGGEGEVEGDSPPAGEVTYTVQAGDTLFSIATSYGLTVDEIVTANGITNPDVLEIGQVLVIPSADSGDAGAGETTGDEGTGDTGTGDEEAVTPEQVYTIQPGDTLGRIGINFGFTPEEIAAYNNIDVNATIYVGDTILIPPSDFSLPDDTEGEDAGTTDG